MHTTCIMDVDFFELENTEWDTSIDNHAMSKLGQMLEDQYDVFNAI